MFNSLYKGTTEFFRKEWRAAGPDSPWKEERVFRRNGSDEIMTEEQFNEYYKRNETATNHIVVI
jgi:hypothetical protein